MTKMTPLQVAEIRKLTRRANRRIERATGGQETYLKGIVKRTTGAEKFSAATKGLTYEQAAKKLKELDKFLGKETTTITGWKKVKTSSVKAGAKKLREGNYLGAGKGYTITDEEFAEILKQVDASNKEELYRAINLVEAAKEAMGEEWTGSSEQISAAIAMKLDFQQALKAAIIARGED